MSDTGEPKQRRPWRKRWMVAALVSVALLVAFNMAAWRRMNDTLARRYAAIRAAGEAVTLAELQKALERENRGPSKALVLLEGALPAAQRISATIAEIPNAADFDDVAASRVDAAWLAEPDLLPALEAAASEPPLSPWVPADLGEINSFLSNVSALRPIATCLYAKAIANAHRMQTCEAFGAGLLLLRLEPHFQRQPFLVGHLFAHATRAMAINALNRVVRADALSRDDRGMLDAQLAKCDSHEPLKRAFREERVFMLAEYENQFRRWPRFFVDRNLVGCLDVIDEEMERIGRPMADAPERKPGAQRLGPALAFFWFDHERFTRPSLSAMRAAHARSLALVRSLRLVNALKRHETEHGTGPARLEDLGLPAGALVDPFSGRQLKFKSSAAGWTVYSVGNNLIDDGGSVDNRLDVGLAPPTRDGAAR